MKKHLITPLAAAVVLCGASVASQAATLKLTSWTFGNGNTVHSSGPSYAGAAGGFSGTLSGTGTSFDGRIDSYCVELGQTFNWNTAYADYNLVAANTYFGNAKATALDKLLSYANPLVVGAAPGSQDDYSTSLQLAIWNLVTDADDTLLGGTFKDSSPYSARATAFLQGAKTQLGNLDLWVLQSRSSQDQLIWQERITTQDVPEPASLALVLAALGGLGIQSRRRRPH